MASSDREVLLSRERNGESVVTSDAYVTLTKRKRRFITFGFIFIAVILVVFFFEAIFYEKLTLPGVQERLANRFTMSFNTQSKEECIESKNNFSNEIMWEDRKALMNVYDFHFDVNNAKLCEPEEGMKILLILVHTSRPHTDERMAIRRSYGSIRDYRGWIVRLAFLFGEADPLFRNPEGKNKMVQTITAHFLAEEAETYGDIIVGNFIDSYKNLTYKHIMGYKWTLNYCSHADYVLKVDDDMFIDVFRILDRFLNKTNNECIICRVFGGSPIRDVGSKWYVSKEEYPKGNYPVYCSGWCYGITMKWIQRIYSVATEVPFLWVDDAFVTGVLKEQAESVYGEKCTFSQDFRTQVTGQKEKYEELCQRQAGKGERLFGSVVYIPRGQNFTRDMLCMWNKTTDDLSTTMHFTLS